jgi:glycosyltransferase involved in cell wall biosynthesis
MESDVQLAIVIPAYKAEYLAEALESLCAQTDKRFRVHIGDDTSPGPIREICDRYRHELDLNYHRFDENLGGDSLVAQWHRCIQLSSEPWVWLFSDDDVMESGCVEAFYVALRETEERFDLFRFNTLTIDGQGQVVMISPPHPPIESGLEFAYHRLCRKRSSFVTEYIFSRKAFTESGGMVEFPAAWCSDDASWIVFAGNKGIFTIYGPRVLWRRSRINISFAAPAHRDNKLEACGLFLDWLCRRYDASETTRELGIEYAHFLECCRRWLHHQVETQVPLGPIFWMKIAREPEFRFLGKPADRFISLVCIDLAFMRRVLLRRTVWILKMPLLILGRLISQDNRRRG